MNDSNDGDNVATAHHVDSNAEAAIQRVERKVDELQLLVAWMLGVAIGTCISLAILAWGMVWHG